MALAIDAAAIDTSVLIAIFEQEPDAGVYATWLAQIPNLYISSVTIYEASIVLLTRRGMRAVDVLHDFIKVHGILEITFDRKFADIALEAYSQYGKGIDPKARLNFGDCAAYALAKGMRARLIYKGDDFSRTDLAYDWEQAAT
ncbi:type II toxin-antitoxin system VapC family toxin [Rhizobium sp. Root483D2]|uniref:type II toxin-antitoxin system VapC family toxin n=1 Tax=Rhizobium sp. Root483D2 TaxID=1736545 RepID=UPI000712599F|nr:type II toxin-antitoxin system VapC family toxin [Rhizobium sp. Root483D2]KQY48849.1 hypothetical protein ASD32_00655 [Rhizobium sp. Root483D2]